MQKLESLDGWDKFCLSQSDIANQKKQKLLEMAKNGELRPSSRRHPLGQSLSSYTGGKHQCYDPIFTKHIKQVAPTWFNVANRKKKRLIQMAKNGESRPKSSSKLGSVLCQYISKKKGNSAYDLNFTKEIKKFAAHWFVNTAEEKRKKLLEMAKRGEKKPKCGKHPLGFHLSRYLNPLSECYNKKLVEELQIFAPSWLIGPSDVVNQNKEKLLSIARSGKSRPNVKRHILGSSLCCYSSPTSNSYDPDFVDQIKRIAPHWFGCEHKKQQLLEMAKNGEAKPMRDKHPLGNALRHYTTRSHDPEFLIQVKKLAPHWFNN